ncbi:hypothetical protein N0V83_006001 [Neocucurbitaria cava]|uniref:Sm domain-containing protein n=1 Tax=Neocucurbitaria cava TaxID=798079 RepID=A0A9W8Y6E0_9PLEO|nr:hypothetical protein N0V83_006001 [Neocucurbitaria cava]
MSFNSNQPHGGPAGPPPNMAQNFNAMLQRSLQEPGQPEQPVEAPGQPSSSLGYGGVYSATPPPQHGPNVLGGGRGPPQQILPVDLPPQAFLTSAMLLDMVDKKVDVLLRDEKEYIGILRSYDQFANLVLTECYERIAARNPEATPSSDATIPRWLIHDVKLPGLMTIRGENVTICATVDLDREDAPRGAKFAEVEEVRALAASQKAEKKEVDSRKSKALKRAGIEPGFGMQG